MTTRLDEWLETTSESTLLGGEYEQNELELNKAISYAIACDLNNGDIPRPEWMIVKEKSQGVLISDEEMPDYEIYLGK